MSAAIPIVEEPDEMLIATDATSGNVSGSTRAGASELWHPGSIFRLANRGKVSATAGERAATEGDGGAAEGWEGSTDADEAREEAEEEAAEAEADEDGDAIEEGAAADTEGGGGGGATADTTPGCGMSMGAELDGGSGRNASAKKGRDCRPASWGARSCCDGEEEEAAGATEGVVGGATEREEVIEEDRALGKMNFSGTGRGGAWGSGGSDAGSCADLPPLLFGGSRVTFNSSWVTAACSPIKAYSAGGKWEKLRKQQQHTKPSEVGEYNRANGKFTYPERLCRSDPRTAS
jgi:hypothetical protein